MYLLDIKCGKKQKKKKSKIYIENMDCLQMTVVQCQILIDKLFSSQG